MPNWDRQLTLFLDVDAPYGRVLIGGPTIPAPLTTPPHLVAGDRYAVTLQFLRQNPDPTLPAAPTDPGADTTLVFSARPAGAPPDSDLLFGAVDWTQVEPGIWTGDLNLNTQAMLDHVEQLATSGSVPILAEVEVRNTDNTARYSLQFDAIARRQVYQGEEATPAALPDPEAYLLLAKASHLHQQASAADTWNITHNLNRIPSVQVLDSSGHTAIGQITHHNPQSLTITFSAALGGTAILT